MDTKQSEQPIDIGEEYKRYGESIKKLAEALNNNPEALQTAIRQLGAMSVHANKLGESVNQIYKAAMSLFQQNRLLQERIIQLEDHVAKMEANQDTGFPSYLQDRFQKLQDLIDVQRSPGNYDYDEYMFGFANGMILAQSTVEDTTPAYMEKVDVWLKDITPELEVVKE